MYHWDIKPRTFLRIAGDDVSMIDPDDTAHDGYQVIAESDCRIISPGDKIPVGFGRRFVPADCPEFGRPIEIKGRRLGKLVPKRWGRVISLSKPYTVFDPLSEGYEPSPLVARRVYFELEGKNDS